MTTELETQPYNVFSGMERSEIEGLTSMANMRKPSIPLKVDYDNILVKGFYSDMKMDPREVFNKILAVAENRIDNTIESFVAKDSVKQVGLDSWQIKIGFITIDLCLHCFTEYDCSEEAFEDTAIHRVVVSISAKFDTKFVYRSKIHATEMFEGLNTLYCNLSSAFNK